MPFFCTLKGLSNKQKKIFQVICTLMISLSDFQPLSIDTINIFSSTTRVLQKDISVTKSIPFLLKRSRYKLRWVTMPVSVDTQVK